MTKDEELAARVRPLLKRRKGFSEKKMFGGVCFLLNGNMCCGTWKGSLIARLDKEDHDDIQREPHTREFDVTGRVMKGWARVMPAGIQQADDLKAWVQRSAKFAGALPPK